MLTALTPWDWCFLFAAIPYTTLPELFSSSVFAQYEYSAHVAKCFPMLILMLWALNTGRSLYVRVCLVTALWLSTCGDWLLVDGDKSSYFVTGVQMFRLSHVGYMALFGSKMRHSSTGALISFLMITGSMTLLLPKLYNDTAVGKPDYLFLIPSYGLAIVAMFYTAICTLQADSRLAAAGAMAFMLSDFCISINLFITPVLGAHYIIHVTYYLSQALLTRAVANGSEVKSKTS
eukprot:TRINITY_DN14415_c0_g1_i1.p1 TRINITY_DN14415_c0_g1~~TRINITY_DN14415_c0_g1_i1.p1  ORF type:complete len:233 (+),score=25.98 TRINITY_DN14415_c0_g1_i1:185-883(+)